MVQSQPRQIVGETLSQKIGLMEWLKVKALSPSTTKKKNDISELSNKC
jgi:hypothetical protein